MRPIDQAFKVFISPTLQKFTKLALKRANPIEPESLKAAMNAVDLFEFGQKKAFYAGAAYILNGRRAGSAPGLEFWEALEADVAKFEADLARLEEKAEQLEKGGDN